jgi:anthranilate phosphoribosyltransferase
MRAAIEAAMRGGEVAAPLLEEALACMFRGEANPAQMAALLIAMRVKGETALELATAAAVMRRHCVRVELAPKPVLLDTCGTGGDGSNSFNISTAAALVAAACGVPVAKHGNRSSSSRAGSADVLEVLGVPVELAAARVARCIEQVGIGFMFARTHHPAMRHVAAVRGQLGVRTMFNLLGPLSNPASATHQVVGVPEPGFLRTLAQAMSNLGSVRAWVVHGHDGMDEISLSGPTLVAELDCGEIREFEIRPEDFGLTTIKGADLSIRDAEHSAAIIRAVLHGEHGPARDVVVLNAAAGLHVAGRASSFLESAQLAAEAIDSGAALDKLDAWIASARS